jgi:hypothetical protein
MDMIAVPMSFNRNEEIYGEGEAHAEPTRKRWCYWRACRTSDHVL